MDYKKMYEEALERAKEIKTKISEGKILGFIDDIEQIFPELRESEDERIRQGLLKVFRNRLELCSSDMFGDLKITDIIVWLEKAERHY